MSTKQTKSHPLTTDNLSPESQEYLNKIRTDFDNLKSIDPELTKPYLKKQLQSETFQTLRKENRESGTQFQEDKAFIEDFEQKEKYIQENQAKVDQLKNKLNPNYNSIKQLEQQRKSQALQFLKDNNMDTPEYRTMINNVQFTNKSINFTNPANGATIPRAHENAKASDFGLDYTVDDKNNPADYSKAHVFKGVKSDKGDFSNEDYFNFAMVDKIAKQGAKVPSYQDMRNTLAALPGGPSGTPPKSPTSTGREVGSAKLMSILLGTEMSGYRYGGGREHCGSSGYLWSRSESDSDCAWACKWVGSGGKLDDCLRECARPLRLLV